MFWDIFFLGEFFFFLRSCHKHILQDNSCYVLCENKIRLVPVKFFSSPPSIASPKTVGSDLLCMESTQSGASEKQNHGAGETKQSSSGESQKIVKQRKNKQLQKRRERNTKLQNLYSLLGLKQHKATKKLQR